MSDTNPPERPVLILFTSNREGRSRRAEGFLAQVLQRRRNHNTFTIHYVAREQHPELHDKFQIDDTPTLVVVENKRVRSRLIQPRGCEQMKDFLDPWLK